MKKKVLFVASLFLATAMFAQDGLTSKKGEAYLPEAGDWAIGFDANPFLQYGGNMFNGATATNSLSGATWTAPYQAATWALYGKYFKDESTAYRLMFRFGMGGTTNTYTQDTAAGFGQNIPFTGSVENKMSSSNGLSFVVGGGLEKRKGNTRIQGYYGGMLMIGILGGGTDTYEYGLTLDSLTTDDAGGFAGSMIADENNLDGSAPTSGTTQRMLEERRGGAFMVGLQGFIGVEWFIFPKVSVGAEYGWGFNMTSVSATERDFEAWTTMNNSNNRSSLQSWTEVQTKSSSWSFDTMAPNGNINIMFHF